MITSIKEYMQKYNIDPNKGIDAVHYVNTMINESLPPPKNITMTDMKLYFLLDRAYKAKSEEEFEQIIIEAIHNGVKPKAPNVPPGAMM